MTSPSPPDDFEARAAAFEPPPATTGGTAGRVLGVVTALVMVSMWGGVMASGLVTPLPAPFVAMLTVLPPLALFMAVWTFALWTLLPDHAYAGWLFAVSLLAPALQWGPAFPARPTAEAGDDTLTVVTWNLRRLWGGPDDGGDPAACIVGALEQADPQVLLLQEVSATELDRVATPLSLTCVHGTYSAADKPDAAGLAVCARGSTWRLDDGEVTPFHGPDDWRFVRASLTDGRRPLTLLGVHLHPYRILHDPVGSFGAAAHRMPATAAAQQAEAEQLLATLDGTAAVVAGDFNATRDTPLHARLRRVLHDAFERGAMGFAPTVHVLGRIPVRIDYVYTTPTVGIVSSQVLETGCSDHRPVVAVLQP